MGFLQNVQYYWTEMADPRVLDLPMINSSYQMPLIICAYLYIMLVSGPRFMKNRQPYSLKTFIKVYNIVQVLVNAWVVYNCIESGLFTNIGLICINKLDYSYDYTPMKFTRIAYYYLLLKILDYVETGVFILRKKNNQVSGLHLYHHVSTSFLSWLGVRYYSVGPTALLIAVNSFVHVLMYTYYFLAALGPNVQKSIASVKRYITIIQMVQFLGLMLYVFQNYIPHCNVIPHSIITIFIGNLMMNFYLFYDFYQKTYRKPRRKIQ